MRKIALLGGIGYLVIFVTGIFANFFVLEELKVVGDEKMTFLNFVNNQSLVVMAFIAFIGMVVFDVILTWVLFVLFKKQEPKLSKITAWFRFINALVFGVALLHFITILDLISNPVSKSGATREMTLALEGFNDIWLIGLVFFGIHLILLSVLLCKSGRVGKVIPALLMIAGIGYIVDTALQFGYSDYASIADISALVVVLPGIIGELSLTFWLFFKAGKKIKKKA